MAGTRRVRILLVEDEDDILTVMSKGLSKFGFEVKAYGDPVKALSEYRPGEFDLLLLDYKMPGIDGFELYRRIRDMDNDVKVCFLSAAVSSYRNEMQARAADFEAKYMIEKPIGIVELVKQINLILGSP
ncbi:MAG TPA: response regulator [Nitrososphaera sp.]|nr:response regulator [Nitrososphaera sp.]